MGLAELMREGEKLNFEMICCEKSILSQKMLGEYLYSQLDEGCSSNPCTITTKSSPIKLGCSLWAFFYVGLLPSLDDFILNKNSLADSGCHQCHWTIKSSDTF